MTAHLERADMSLIDLETNAAENNLGMMHTNLEENGFMSLSFVPKIRPELFTEEIEETIQSNLQENGVMCSSNGPGIEHKTVIEELESCSINGMDADHELLLLHVQSHKETDAVDELSRSLEGITIETTKMDIKQAKIGSEGYAQHSINNLVVAAPDNGSFATEGDNCSNKEEVYSTKASKFTTVEGLKGQKPASPNTSVRCMAQIMTQKKQVHEETENGKRITRLLNSRDNINHLSPSCSTSTTKASSPKVTIARPFSLATDRRAEERPATILPTCPSDFPQDAKSLRQKFFVAKSSHSTNIQHSVSQDLKVHTIATGFTFRSDERAKKRKEFFCRLQEKNSAKEEEKTQMQARSEKEDEEALKVLRRSLTFKASPMPSFYQEGPSPEADRKKISITQAKSPKFTNRSRSVGSKSVSNGLLSQAEHSHNYGLRRRLESNVADTLHQSKELLTKNLAKSSLSDLPAEKISNSNLTNEGAPANDNMNERNFEETSCESVIMIRNEDTKESQVSKGAKTTKESSSENHERFQGKVGRNVLRNCDNKSLRLSSSMSNKIKPKHLHHQPLPYDMKEDVSPKANKSTKKERLKALTPYFRKRESIGNTRKPSAILTGEFPLFQKQI